jgi:hypothetical protein
LLYFVQFRFGCFNRFPKFVIETLSRFRYTSRARPVGFGWPSTLSARSRSAPPKGALEEEPVGTGRTERAPNTDTLQHGLALADLQRGALTYASKMTSRVFAIEERRGRRTRQARELADRTPFVARNLSPGPRSSRRGPGPLGWWALISSVTDNRASRLATRGG